MTHRPSRTTPLVLALDLGTSALKAGLCDADGRLHGSVTVPFAQIRGDGELSAEGDAGEWAGAAWRAIGELARDELGARVDALVVSGHGPSLVAVDRSGKPVRRALLWLDRRAVREAEEIRELWGRPVESWHFLPKALWLARREPRSYEASAHLMSCPEYLSLLLTGVARTVLHTEAFRHYYWSDEIVEKLGLDPRKLPPFVAPGDGVGALLPEAAARTGLRAGVPVYAGGPDFLMSLLGTATVSPGRVCDRAGSSEGVNLCATREVLDARLQCQPHVVRPFWNVAGMIPASGLALEWIKTLAGGPKSHEELFDRIEGVPAGSRGLLFLPFTGVAGGFAGLDLRHGQAEMARAVVESVGYALRDILVAMAEHCGRVEYMTVTGGQARLERWTQLKADVTGVPVRVPVVPDAEIVGGAVVGFVALGEHSGLGEAAEEMVRIAKTVEPRPEVASRYAELHDRLRPLREGLRDATAELLRFGPSPTAS